SVASRMGLSEFMVVMSSKRTRKGGRAAAKYAGDVHTTCGDVEESDEVRAVPLEDGHRSCLQEATGGLVKIVTEPLLEREDGEGGRNARLPCSFYSRGSGCGCDGRFCSLLNAAAIRGRACSGVPFAACARASRTNGRRMGQSVSQGSKGQEQREQHDCCF